MGYIPNELSGDEARNLYSQGELSADEARHLSGGSYDPDGRLSPLGTYLNNDDVIAWKEIVLPELKEGE